MAIHANDPRLLSYRPISSFPREPPATGDCLQPTTGLHVDVSYDPMVLSWRSNRATDDSFKSSGVFVAPSNFAFLPCLDAGASQHGWRPANPRFQGITPDCRVRAQCP
jgi:hypothetical protein